MTRRPSVAKLIMLSTVAMTRGGSAPAADWSHTLDASANVAYETNPTLVPGSTIADRSAQLSVDGNTRIATEVSQLTVTPRLAIVRYDEEKDLDNTAGSLTLAFQNKGERGQWTASGLAQTDSTLKSELGQTGVTNVNFQHYGYDASVGYQYLATERLSWQLQGFGQITQYNSGAQQYGLIGYNYAGIQLGPAWSFSERLQGSLSFEANQLHSQIGTTERDYSAIAQLKRSLSEQYSWRANAGATRVEAQGSPAASTAVFEVAITRKTERVQWDLSAKRDVVPIGFGFLARQDVAALTALVDLSEKSTLSVSFDAIHTDPVSTTLYLAPGVALGYQVYSGAAWGQASAEWQYRLSPQWALSAAYMQARARSYSVADWANGNQARIGVVWQSARL